jgi:predicted O-methyltransferase YrrM
MSEEKFPEGMLEEIQRFFRDDSSRPAGWDLYPEVFETGYFFPLQRKQELRTMLQAARKVRPRTLLDIGSDKGGGLYHWCKGLPTLRKVISIEIKGTPYAEEFEKAFPQIQFFWIPGSSYEIGNYPKVVKFLEGDALDVLFLDGDKTAFQRDFDFYRPLLRPGSIAFLHDIQDPIPGEAFRVLKNRGYRTQQILETEEWKEVERNGIRNSYDQWLYHWQGRSCGVGIIYL